MLRGHRFRDHNYSETSITMSLALVKAVKENGSNKSILLIKLPIRLD